MKVEFCRLDSGDVVFTKDSKDLEDIINVITKVGTEIHLSFSKDDFIHGYVQNVMYLSLIHISKAFKYYFCTK